VQFVLEFGCGIDQDQVGLVRIVFVHFVGLLFLGDGRILQNLTLSNRAPQDCIEFLSVDVGEVYFIRHVDARY